MLPILLVAALAESENTSNRFCAALLHLMNAKRVLQTG